MNNPDTEAKIRDNLDEASHELRRADHSIYATLKYARTGDVLKSILERFANAYKLAIEAVLLYACENKSITIIPDNNENRIKLFLDLYPDMKENVEEYNFLRSVLKAGEYRFIEEFRKNITLICETPKGETCVNVEDIEKFFYNTKKFVKYIEELIC